MRRVDSYFDKDVQGSDRCLIDGNCNLAILVGAISLYQAGTLDTAGIRDCQQACSAPSPRQLCP